MEEGLTRDYLHWLESGEAFDFGTAFGAVFEGLSAKMAQSDGLADLQETHRRVVKDVAVKIDSAGVNPAHRNAVIAMFSTLFPTNEAAAAAARLETSLTHLHPAAVDTSVAVVVICRELILGRSVQGAVAAAILLVQHAEVIAVLQRYSDNANRSVTPRLSTGGYSPQTLEAALHFVSSTTSFEEAWTASISFAGCANYCPVLVGSIAGALYGDAAVPSSSLSVHPHVTKRLRDDLLALADDIARRNYPVD